MSELSDIKARAAERRNRSPISVGGSTFNKIHEAEADLDRAIAIAEELDRLRTEVTLEVIESDYAKELSQAHATITKLEKECEYVRDIEAQRDKARAAALALRDCLSPTEKNTIGGIRKVMADTAWLEEHR